MVLSVLLMAGSIASFERGRLVLVLGLVSALEQCFSRKSMFFTAELSAAEAPHLLKTNCYAECCKYEAWHEYAGSINTCKDYKQALPGGKLPVRLMRRAGRLWENLRLCTIYNFGSKTHESLYFMYGFLVLIPCLPLVRVQKHKDETGS